jgi:hypothetical protein
MCPEVCVTYLVAPADAGARIRSRVTVRNPSGASTPEPSAYTKTVPTTK